MNNVDNSFVHQVLPKLRIWPHVQKNAAWIISWDVCLQPVVLGNQLLNLRTKRHELLGGCQQGPVAADGQLRAAQRQLTRH
jgi:hypothetical protein